MSKCITDLNKKQPRSKYIVGINFNIYDIYSPTHAENFNNFWGAIFHILAEIGSVERSQIPNIRVAFHTTKPYDLKFFRPPFQDLLDFVKSHSSDDSPVLDIDSLLVVS